MESWKVVLMNLFAGKEWRHRQTTDLWTLGNGKEWDRLREPLWNMHITICKVDGQWAFALWHRKLKPVLCDNLEDEVGGGREVQQGGDICILWLIHVTVWQKPIQCQKAVILQLKKKLASLDLSLEQYYPLVLTPFLLISGPESAEFLSWRLWNLRGKRYHFYSQKLPFEEAGITQ